MSHPTFITYRDRRTFLDKTLTSLEVRGFDQITVIDNDSADPLPQGYRGCTVVHSDNSHRQLAPWMLDLVPGNDWYTVLDCDIELDCPDDVEQVLIDALKHYPEIEKLGLGIRTDDLLFPPPQRYAWSYLMEYSVERGTRFHEIGETWGPYGTSIIDAPVDTHFAMHRPGHGWPGIVGARTTAPYLCRHLPWYEEEYSEDEKLYYSRAGNAWTMGHSAGSLLETTIAVPFTELRAETVAALHDEQVRYAPMLFDDSYYQLLRDLWKDGKAFITIEHDIVVNETTIDELKVCDQDWCAMPFPYRDDPKAFSLACTRFSAALIRRHPDLMDEVAQMYDDRHPPMHWCRMDAWIYGALTARGEKRHDHVHAQALGHVGNQYPKHGCL